MLHEPALKQDSECLLGTHKHARHTHSHSITQAAHPNIAHCHSADLAVPSEEIWNPLEGWRGEKQRRRKHTQSFVGLLSCRFMLRNETTASSRPSSRWERQVSLRLTLVRRPPTVPAAPRDVDGSLRGDRGRTESYNVQYAT